MDFKPFQNQRRWIPAFAGMTSQSMTLANLKQVPINPREAACFQSAVMTGHRIRELPPIGWFNAGTSLHSKAERGAS